MDNLNSLCKKQGLTCMYFRPDLSTDKTPLCICDPFIKIKIENDKKIIYNEISPAVFNQNNDCKYFETYEQLGFKKSDFIKNSKINSGIKHRIFFSIFSFVLAFLLNYYLNKLNFNSAFITSLIAPIMYNILKSFLK